MVKCKICYEYKDSLYPEMYPIMACKECGNNLVECYWWIYEDEYEGEW